MLAAFVTIPRLPLIGAIGAKQTLTVESTELIAAVGGGNRTVSGGEDVVIDLAATLDPDEVQKIR